VLLQRRVDVKLFCPQTGGPGADVGRRFRQGKGEEMDPDKEAKIQRAKAIMSGTMGMVIEVAGGGHDKPHASQVNAFDSGTRTSSM
jgi:hypothetical protein